MAVNNNAPAYKVTIDGTVFTQHDPQGLENLIIEDDMEMIGRAEFSFRAGNSGQAPWSTFKVGGSVQVEVGDSSRKMFVGKITEVNPGQAKGASVCTVVAMDPLHEAATSKKTRTWEDKKDSDIISEVLGSYGDGVTADPTEYTNPYMHQKNESDFKFARRLAARNGYHLYADEGKIMFSKPPQQSGGGVAIKNEEIIDFDFKQGSNPIPGSVKVQGWNYAKKEKIEGTATAQDIPKIGGGQIAVGEGAWNGEEMMIEGVDVSDQNLAKVMATSELYRRSTEFIRGNMTVQGRGDLYVGAIVKITQQQNNFNAEVMVTSARHKVSNKTGLVSMVEFCSNTKPQ